MGFPVFASGDVLNASDMNAVGGWLVKTQTVGSGVGTVTVTGAFTSDYNAYKIIYSGGSASGGAELLFTLRNGASELTTGWFYRTFGYTYGGVLVNNGLNNAGYCQVGGTDTGWAGASFEVQNPMIAVNKIVNVQTFGFATYVATAGAVGVSTASWPDFRLFTSAGTLTGGTIRVYGFRN